MSNNKNPNESRLLPVWQQTELLLSQGISLIPVRDKEEVINGRSFGPKTPTIATWKKFQQQIITKEELWFEMERTNTTAIAMICGAVSGNLEVIDIDVKHWQGIDVRYLADVRDLMPDLFPRLRIHRTPSGGVHIPFRVSDGPAMRNQKLAYKFDSKECGIETRGEGGYVLAPPSMGYTVIQGDEIPYINSAERDNLFHLCKLYNEKVKVEQVRTTKYDNNYYSENPFDHFNSSPAAENLLEDHGWKRCDGNQRFTRYTRPGKDAGVSASFMHERKAYYFFTTSTEFEGSRQYLPSSVLSILLHGGDRKKTFQYLVEQGFGKVRPEVERKLVKSKAIKGGPLPANVSPEAHQALSNEIARVTETYPHGLFWYFNENRAIINREGLYTVSAGLGFRYYKNEIVQIVGKIVFKRTERFYFDSLKDYIKEEEYEVYETIANALENFLQKSGKYSIGRLPELNPDDLCRSTKTKSFKFYKNGFVVTTPDTVTLHDYSELDGLVLEDVIQQRDYKTLQPGYEGKYLKFLKLSVDFDLTQDHVLPILGFLSHDFKDETTGYLIVLTEICEDPRQGGGSGKNVFCMLMKYQTSYTNLPGALKKIDEKFLQHWNNERIVAISDVLKNFDFTAMKELITGSGVVKKLFRDEYTVGPSEMPKFIVQTNFSFEISDGGLRRRIIPIEFTDFFTKAGGVDVYFGAHFPNDWSEQDWAEFDHIIHLGIQRFMKAGCKLYPAPLSMTGWIKQFDQTYGSTTRAFIEEHLDAWVQMKNVPVSVFNDQYDTFKNHNQIKHGKTTIEINRGIEEWCKKHEIIFIRSHTTSVNGFNQKVRRFEKLVPF